MKQENKLLNLFDEAAEHIPFSHKLTEWTRELTEVSKTNFIVNAVKIMKEFLFPTNYNSTIYMKTLAIGYGKWVEIKTPIDLQKHFFLPLSLMQEHSNLVKTFNTLLSVLIESNVKPNVIYTKDSILSIDRKTGELSISERDTALEREYIPTMPIEYNKEAEVPVWFANAIKSAFDNNDELIRSYFQMIALTLFQERSMEVSYWFTGEGNTGKSTLIVEVLESLLNKERDISSVEPHLWDGEKFMLQSMFGKRLNLSTDSSVDKVLETGAFKKLVSGETIMVNIKNMSPRTFNNKALLVSVGNNMPIITEKSDGPFRRMIMVPMDNKIVDVNLHFKEDIRKNKDNVLGGIFKYAVEAMCQLYKHNLKPAIPTVSKVALEDQKTINNTVRQFAIDEFSLEESIRQNYFTANTGLKQKNLYTWYKDYCLESGIKYPYTKLAFIKAFKKEVDSGFVKGVTYKDINKTAYLVESKKDEEEKLKRRMSDFLKAIRDGKISFKTEADYWDDEPEIN